eukprot:365205-Chlamydomonas_euryale.AAC.23
MACACGWSGGRGREDVCTSAEAGLSKLITYAWHFVMVASFCVYCVPWPPPPSSVHYINIGIKELMEGFAGAPRHLLSFVVCRCCIARRGLALKLLAMTPSRAFLRCTVPPPPPSLLTPASYANLIYTCRSVYPSGARLRQPGFARGAQRGKGDVVTRTGPRVQAGRGGGEPGEAAARSRGRAGGADRADGRGQRPGGRHWG